jgi:hypothetical protein
MKLEELPENTVVDSKEHGMYMKSSSPAQGPLWMELGGHCGECAQLLSEAGTDNPGTYTPDITQAEPASVYLGEFEIIAVPPGFEVKGLT